MLIGEVDTSTVIARDFSTPLISMDRISRQKINKETGLKGHILPYELSSFL